MHLDLHDIQISFGCTPGYQVRKGLHTRTVKIKIFNIYQKDLISCGKIENLKIAVLSLFKQENCL